VNPVIQELFEDAISILLEDGVAYLSNVFVDHSIFSNVLNDISKITSPVMHTGKIRSFKNNSVDSYLLFDENNGTPLIPEVMLEIDGGKVQRIWNSQNLTGELISALHAAVDAISNTIFCGMIKREYSFLLPPGRDIVAKKIHRTSSFGSKNSYTVILFIEPDVNNLDLYSYVLGSHRLCSCELNPCICRSLDVNAEISFSSPVIRFKQEPGSVMIVNDACLSDIQVQDSIASGCYLVKKIYI
tara:strand:- start:31852 stop:32580 length:729 start_codon:yes stop_codon:yes gene_type:complete